MDHIQHSVEGAIATVRLNRPERLNALSEDMKDRLGDLFLQLGQDKSVRAVMLSAAGRGFCASGDVSTMGQFTATTAMERLKRAHRWVLALAAIDKPVIAAVRGPVAGAGWSMALACDVVLASETAVFSQVFKNMGLIPDSGALWFLAQHLGPLRAKELIFTGRKLPAAEAHALGLVTSLVPDERLEEEALRWARELAEGPTFAYGLTKKAFRQLAIPSLEQALDAEAAAQSVALLTEDHREGVKAFLEKRPARFRGE
jgi:2-(1,2-epoxy-1,2-dihydrophenyl)acetyl-CoA isomerase